MGAETPARHPARHAQARARARHRDDRQARRRLELWTRGAHRATTSANGWMPPTWRARRRMSPAIIRNGSSRISPARFGDARAEEGAALASRAPLDLRVNTLKADATRSSGRDAVRPQARAGALVALGPAHPAWRRCQEPGDPCRAGVPQRHDRGAGRRLATGRAVFGRQARRAGDRSVRRRRRQDAGARRDDAEQGAGFRHRRRQAAAGADPRPAGAFRARATCRCARRNRSAARSTIWPAAATWC